MAYEDAGLDPLEQQLLQRNRAGTAPILDPQGNPVTGAGAMAAGMGATPGGNGDNWGVMNDFPSASGSGGPIPTSMPADGMRPTNVPPLNPPGGTVAPIVDPAAPVVDPAAPPPVDYTKLGQFGSRLAAGRGVSEKIQRPWDKQSERYKMLTVLSHFDPNNGLTPEVIAALNAANIHGAKFSGSKDKLTVENAGNWKRFGVGGTGDIIGGFNNPNKKVKEWAAWDNDAAANKPGLSVVNSHGPGSGVPPTAGGGLLGSDALNSMMQDSTYNTMQKRLQEILGPQSTNRNVLMQQLLKRG